MRRFPRILGLALVICATAATTALAVTPPAGTPDLSQMVIQAGDLAPGAQIVKDGYAAAPAGITAAYSREWGPDITAGGRRLIVAASGILLLSSDASATTVLAGERRVFASKKDRPSVAKVIALNAGNSGIKAKDIGFGHLRSAAIGDGAFSLPLSLRFKGHRLGVDLYVLQVKDVIAEVVTFARKHAPAAKGGHELATDIAAHITATLATSGPTGPTGSTGATS